MDLQIMIEQIILNTVLVFTSYRTPKSTDTGSCFCRLVFGCVPYSSMRQETTIVSWEQWKMEYTIHDTTGTTVEIKCWYTGNYLLQ
jgi:hypothetical protein